MKKIIIIGIVGIGGYLLYQQMRDAWNRNKDKEFQLAKEKNMLELTDYIEKAKQAEANKTE